MACTDEPIVSSLLVVDPDRAILPLFMHAMSDRDSFPVPIIGQVHNFFPDVLKRLANRFVSPVIVPLHVPARIMSVPSVAIFSAEADAYSLSEIFHSCSPDIE